jgi:hypothetical protein
MTLAKVANCRDVLTLLPAYLGTTVIVGGPGDAFDISTLVNPGPGRMLGVLICEAPDNGSERIVLKAFSGQVAWINYCDGNLSPTTLKIHNFILRSPRNIFP